MRPDPEQPDNLRRETITSRFWDWIDERMIVRRSVLLFTLGMTAAAGYYGWQFATVSRFDGAGTALVIAAFTAPVTVLQKAAFEAYVRVREKATP